MPRCISRSIWYFDKTLPYVSLSLPAVGNLAMTIAHISSVLFPCARSQSLLPFPSLCLQARYALCLCAQRALPRLTIRAMVEVLSWQTETITDRAGTGFLVQGPGPSGNGTISGTTHGFKISYNSQMPEHLISYWIERTVWPETYGTWREKKSHEERL